MTETIAIIGAGMAGASAARILHEAGLPVTLFDKGRGIGGRMATRRLADGLTFDHGAQYVTARDPAFAADMASWTRSGAAAPWGEPGWSVGVPGMTEPVRGLLRGCPVTTGCTISRLVREEGGWILRDADGERLPGLFSTVLITAPAPQARALSAPVAEAWPALHEALGRVRYAPCWALMLSYSGEAAFAQTHRREPDAAAPIAWIARDGTKPGRAAGRESLVVHASPGWSKAHLEDERPAVVAQLTAELRHVLGPSLPAPEALAAHAHRWRYAQVEQAVGEPCLWSPDLRLGVAGDGCLGGRVEAAYLSGRALAERVLAATA